MEGSNLEHRWVDPYEVVTVHTIGNYSLLYEQGKGCGQMCSSFSG